MAFPSTGIYPSPLVTFATSVINTTGGTTVSFAATNIGSAASDRVVVVGIYGQGATAGVSVSSLTIAGITASIATQVNTGGVLSALTLASVVPSTTATIVVDFTSGGVARGGIGVWTVTGYQAITSIATSNATQNNSTVIAVTDSIPPKGAIIALAGSFASLTTTLTWAGATADFNDQIQANTNFGGAHLNKANRSQTVSATFGTATTSELVVIAMG